LKRDAVVVIELKAYPGLITFPIERDFIWQAWTFEHDGIQGVVNDGGPSPYQQVTDNAKAVQAFLESHEQQFADDETRGSLWHKLQKVILFSAINVRFASVPPDVWRGTMVAALESEQAADFDITKYLSDLTTAPIHYKADHRSQIHLSDTAIRALAGILKAEEFSFCAGEPDMEQVVFPEYGIEPIVALGTRMTVPCETKQVPDSIRGEQVPLRVLSYYIACVEELAKQESSIDLAKPGPFHFIQNRSETVFLGDGQFLLDDNQIPDRFLTQDARFTYGFMPVISTQTWKDSPSYSAAPLFMRDMRIVREKGRYICQSLSHNEVTVNRSALKYFTAMKNLSTEEVEKLLMETEKAGTAEDQIRYLLDAVGVEWQESFREMGGYEYAALREGLLPLGVLFQSSSGVYNRMLKELGQMREAWRMSRTSPDDLAWRLLDSLNPEHVSRSWKPARLCVIPSNYEQSQGVGLAVENKGLLQIISGPPGTGKTQVIQNIIVNAADNGQKVIFASRNNKAVDVVVERMNGGILPFPFVFRTGSNQQNQKFAAFLRSLDQVDTSDSGQFLELKSQELAIRGDLRQLGGKLQQLHQGLELARKARRDMDEADREIDALRDENEGLFAIANWYDKQESDFGAGAWRGLVTAHERDTAAGAGLINRIVTCYKIKLGLRAMADRGFYDSMLREGFIRRLNECLPDELILAIGRDNLIAASGSVLPVLESLNSLSHRYADGLETLKKYDEARILEDWSKVEAERIEPSKKILTLEWHKRRNDASIRAVTNLLEDWKSRTPFADVLSVFPCCATTTLSVGNKIPLSPGMFDMAVIDEASQADVASCLPILHRARRAIIIGDEMQLRPIVTLPEPKNEELLQAFGLEGEKFRRYDFRTSSMLDLAYDRFTAAGGRRLVLKDHYRCHPDIISYSNRCFYDGCLRIRTSRNTGPGLYLHPCEGEAHPRWRNPAEIDIVLTLVTRTLAAGYGHAQIGVVTPFRQQAEAIINRLRNEDLFEGDSGIVAVSTAHGFQGDERDVMILSLVVANNMPSGTIKWIHDINTDSKNLLNVAVTRARRELHVVANEKVCTSAGGLLRELMAHCRSHSDHDQTKRTPN
jgi:RecA/RadA recombinase